MNKYEEITAARKILELPETATMASIKSNYRRLLARWHPDKHPDNTEECAETTRKVVAAYETIVDYCLGYRYSFSEDAVKMHLSADEWWFDRFGDDPLWGRGGPPK